MCKVIIIIIIVIVIIIPCVQVVSMNCNWFYFFFSVPETVDDETDGTDREPALRLLALLHFPTMVVLILIFSQDFFTRLCYLTSLVDVVSTEDVDEPLGLMNNQ